MSADDLSGTGHALMVEIGDCEFYGRCECGLVSFGCIRPNQSLDEFQMPWERHVMSVRL
jgi:hypothetical protein